MPTVSIDLSPYTYAFKSTNPLGEGGANLLRSMIEGPIKRANLERQQQQDAEAQGRELWQMHRAEDQTARENTWHDQAQQNHTEEYARSGQWHDQAEARQTMNDYLTAQNRSDQLKAKNGKARGPQSGDIAPSHIVSHLTTELVQVPKTDAFGDVVKGPDGQPVLTYARQPSKDADRKLRAAGIDPATLRYADPGSLKQDEPQLDYSMDPPTEHDLQGFHDWARGPGGPDAPAPAPAAAPSGGIGDWLSKHLTPSNPQTPDNGEVTGNDFNPPGDPNAPEPAAAPPAKVMPRAILLRKAQKAGITPAAAEKHYTDLGYTIGD